MAEAKLLDRAEFRYGLVLILLLATFVLLMAGSTSEWARLASVALTGATLVAALFASGASPRLRRLAIMTSLIAFTGALSVVAFGRSGEAGAMALLNAALVALAPIFIARSAVRRREIDIQTVLAASLCLRATRDAVGICLHGDGASRSGAVLC